MAVENSDSAIKGVNRREKKVLLTWSWIKRHRIILMLAMIVLISVFLRFYDLGTKSIWTNEAQSILESNLSVQGMVKASNQPPLYDLILHNWISLFGTSEAALRFPSAIFSVLTVVVIYFAGSALFHKRTGLIAAFISSFSSFLIAYSYDARDYALLALLSTLSYWFFIEIIRKDEKKYYAAYIVSSILLIFTHFYSLFIIASQVLFILIFIKKYKAKISKYAIIMGIPIMFGAIPMLMLLKGNISHIAEEGFWISVPGNLSTVETLVNFSGSGPAKYEIFGIFSLFAILGIFMLIKQRYRHTSTDVDQPRQSRLQSQEIIILLLLWLLIPILIPFIESKLMTPIYLDRYTIGACPALALLVATGLNTINWRWSIQVLAVIVILSGSGLYGYLKSDSNFGENWRKPVQEIEAQSQQNDVILFYPSQFQVPFDYYYKGNLTEKGVDSIASANKFIDSKDGQAIGHSRRLWLDMARNDPQIYDLFVSTYGNNSIKSSHWYPGNRLILFDP